MMASICTSSTRKNGATCDHRLISVALDGANIDLHVTQAELDDMPWTAEEQRQFVLLGLKRLRVLGQALDSLAGRVISGEEATNVKQFALLSKDVTKTNIGTAYVNIPPGLNGERSLVEFTGATEWRLVCNMNALGVGPWQLRVVRDADSAVLYESPSIVGAGEKELDTGWLPLPAEASGLMLVRLQGRSAVGTDDPVVRRCLALVK